MPEMARQEKGFQEKDLLIETLTNELNVLRVKLGITQEKLASMAGISRQTYSLVESKKRKMTWSTFMSLIMIFSRNEATRDYLDYLGILNRLDGIVR